MLVDIAHKLAQAALAAVQCLRATQTQVVTAHYAMQGVQGTTSAAQQI
jgi:hypothetical protein